MARAGHRVNYRQFRRSLRPGRPSPAGTSGELPSRQGRSRCSVTHAAIWARERASSLRRMFSTCALRGPRRNGQALGNGLISQPLGDQFGHLELTAGQPRPGADGLAQETEHRVQGRGPVAVVEQDRRARSVLRSVLRVTAAHRYTGATSHSVFGVMGPQNCTTVHQAAQIPGGGVFYPVFYPKRLRSGAEMSYLLVTAAKSRGSAGMCQQLPKLIVRVRFPSPAPL